MNFKMRTMHLMSRIRNITAEDVKSFSLRALNMKSNLRVHYFRHISNVILLVAICVGLYARWMQSPDTVVLVISISSLFVFSIAAAMVYYFSMDGIGFSLIRLWVGCLLGMVAFTDKALIKYDTSEEVMNILFITSLIVRCFWNVLERVMHVNPVTSNMDGLETLGMCVASVMCGKDFAAVCLLLGALALTVQAIRLKSFMAVLNLICLCILTSWQFFPKILQKSVNPFPLICFVARIAFEPIIDLYFSNLTMLERWTRIFSWSSLFRKFVILLIVILEVTFYAFCAKQMPRHKEWFIVVPIFAAFSLVWWSYHIVFVITLWQLNNKISDCTATRRNVSEESYNLSSILASRGVRHFSLIAQRLMTLTFLTTVILKLIGWITKSAVSLSLFFTVLPIEVVLMSLLWELGRVLGGTCTGYALVAPITPHTRDQSPKVLPTNAVQEMSLRATTTLNKIQHFMTYHLIDMFGCDYTSSGLTQESLEVKLKSFFQRVTADGPLFDTYLVYYSGHVYDNGDWALADDGHLKLETIMELWREYNAGSGARLILVLDTSGSHHWVSELRRHNDVVVAIQTCRAVKPSKDPEVGAGGFRVGDFTQEWVQYNCGGIKTGVETAESEDEEGAGLVSGSSGQHVDWQSKGRVVRAVYKVTRAWADFRFRMPTKEDMGQHWDSNFPKVTKPIFTVTNFPQFGQLCCCTDWVFRCLRRLRLRWLPPLELDTGHGFKLVRS